MEGKPGRKWGGRWNTASSGPVELGSGCLPTGSKYFNIVTTDAARTLCVSSAYETVKSVAIRE